MSFFDTAARAKSYLLEHGRVSVRALRREFALDDEGLEELIEELVDVQRVATRDRSVVRAYQEAASGVIQRHAGHIAQYLGDGLLVYFGHPQAHEDDAERAVRAGLEILAALRSLNDTLEPPHGIRLAARVGIHTGPVVIGAMGRGAKSEVLALGDTTNIAARVEGMAKPDTVVITAATQRLVGGLFVVEERGPQALKGVGEPLTLYRVVQPSGVRSRLDVAAGRLTRFVGRDIELATLVDRWERAQDGEGQNVVVLGEAGVGKSRLVYRLHEHLAAVPHTWLECGATPYTEGTPFHPILALAAQGLGLTPEDTAAEKLAKVETGLGALASAENVALLADFLGLVPPTRLQFSPELQRRKTIDVLAQWNLAMSEVQPLVLFVEDLHWCDVSTLELLGHLIAQSPTARVMLLATARPEFTPPWPARENLGTVQLARLTKRQARDMIATLAGAELPAATLDALVARADGVPLYVEELTKSVVEPGTARDVSAPPAPLADALQGRLDRLPPAKAAAPRAAVLGRAVGYPLLAAPAGL
ncbi:MAG: AAA family ATPase, partial [Proteobacteria bacterium]|nr:AAA family ATPase [Pseudomonadota bacterium]